MQKLNIRFATMPTHVSDYAAAVGMDSMESSTQDVPDRPTILSGKTSKAWLYFNTQSSTSQKAVCTILSDIARVYTIFMYIHEIYNKKYIHVHT